MDRIRFLWNNTKFDSSLLTATSEKSGLPADNVQDTLRRKPWATDGTGRASLFVDMGETVTCGALGLVSYEFSLSATVTLRGVASQTEKPLSAAASVSKDSGAKTGLPCTAHGFAAGDSIFVSGTQAYDGIHLLGDQSLGGVDEIILDTAYVPESFTGAETTAKVTQDFEMVEDVWESVYGYGTLGFGEAGFGGSITEDYLEFTPRLSKVYYMTEPQSYRYWEIYIDNGGETSADEFSVGRIFLCPYFEPLKNFAYGWSWQLIDPSVTSKSIGGVKYTDRRESFVKVAFQLPYLTKTEAFQEMLHVFKTVGTRSDCIISMAPNDETLRWYTGIYGRFTQIPALVEGQPNLFQTSVEFEESV